MVLRKSGGRKRGVLPNQKHLLGTVPDGGPLHGGALRIQSQAGVDSSRPTIAEIALEGGSKPKRVVFDDQCREPNGVVVFDQDHQQGDSAEVRLFALAALLLV